MAFANIEKGWAGGTWDGSKVTDTDWTDFVTRTGITHEHTLSARGGTKNIADVCKELDCKMIYISTDYVFNGQGEKPWEPDCKDYAYQLF